MSEWSVIILSGTWVRRIALGGLWLGLIVYAFGFAPPEQPDTAELILNLSTGQWRTVNPWIVSLFNVMGVWPVIYAALVLVDGKRQSFPAWPFVAGSFALGAFALLPYLVLRQAAPQLAGEGVMPPVETPPPKTSIMLGLSNSRWLGGGCAIAIIALLIYGLSQGNWADFVAQWHSSRFIHVMSLDFCLLCVLFPLLLKDDMAQRQLRSPALFWVVSLIPLLGPALYLTLRPPLAAEAQPS